MKVALTSDSPHFEGSFSAITFETLLDMDLLTSE